MTNISAPNTGVGVLPKRRSRRVGSIVGAVALVIAVGAAAAIGIAVSGDDVPVVSVSDRTYTKAREGQPESAVVDRADVAHLNRAADLSAAAVSSDDVPVVSVSDRTIAKARESQPQPSVVDRADVAHLNRAADLARG